MPLTLKAHASGTSLNLEEQASSKTAFALKGFELRKVLTLKWQESGIVLTLKGLELEKY